MPWWTALLIAVTTTAIGYGIDAGSGHKELTSVFAGLYIAGCVAAVLAVRQEGLFTAVIQPPLILFCAVPGAYWLFHGGKVGNLKDLLINCGYPLIERFPLMLGTAGGSLADRPDQVVLRRCRIGRPRRRDTTDGTAPPPHGAKSSFISGISAKLNSLLGMRLRRRGRRRDIPGDSKRARAYFPSGPRPEPAEPHAAVGPPASARSRPGRPGRRWKTSTTPWPSGRGAGARRRPVTTIPPNRRAGRGGGRGRRADPDQRGQPPRENRRDPRARRNPYERSAPRSSRFDGYDRYEPPGAAEPFNRYGMSRTSPTSPPRSSAASSRTPNGTNGANPTHHPISQVRYRGSRPSDEPEASGAPNAGSITGKAGAGRPAESWEYDV